MSSETWPRPDREPGPLPNRRFLLTGVFVGLVVVGLIAASIISGDAGAPTGPDPAPDFTVTLFDGGEFHLSRHLAEDGRPVLLNLWASWCGPCRAEMPAISAWAARNPNVYVIGVAVEDVAAKARELAAELQTSHDLAIGDGSFRADYPSLGLPATYAIDEDGRIAKVFNGILNKTTLDALFVG